MAKDLSKSKKLTGSIFPERVYDATGVLNRIEPLLDGETFRKRFFFGFNLISPVTREKITNSDLEDYILRAVSQFELDTKLHVTPVIMRHRLPFDPNLYHMNIWTQLPNKPIQKVIRMAICSASYTGTSEENEQYPSGAEIYRIPNEWIDVSYAVRGTLFVNPLNPAFSAIGTNTAVSTSGATILQFIGQIGFVPAYWTVECVHGFCTEDGRVPIIVNECIGAKAAMMLIDNLLPLFKITSQSLSIDGLGQSVNDLSYQLLQQKRQLLDTNYRENVQKLKTMTANNLFTGHV